jgi:hypothetical protein
VTDVNEVVEAWSREALGYNDRTGDLQEPSGCLPLGLMPRVGDPPL